METFFDILVPFKLKVSKTNEFGSEIHGLIYWPQAFIALAVFYVQLFAMLFLIAYFLHLGWVHGAHPFS